jgi:integrase
MAQHDQGGMNGRPLSARTVGHAHRVLHRALERAVKNETLSRNVSSAVSPPKIEAREIDILTGEQIASVLSKLEGHELYPIVALALATGMRRGELLALRWEDVDLDNATLKVERSLEESDRGLPQDQARTPADTATADCNRGSKGAPASAT